MSSRTRTTLILLSAAALLTTATACSSATDTEAQAKKQPVRSSEPSRVKATPAADANDPEESAESVERAPDLGSGDSVAVRQQGTRGNRALEFPEARKDDGDALTIAVRCQGEGRLDITLRPLSATFPVTCHDDDVTTAYNQFALSAARDAGTVSVTASPTTVWSLTIGRGDRAEADLTR